MVGRTIWMIVVGLVAGSLTWVARGSTSTAADDDIVRAANLPRRAIELRTRGMPSLQVQATLRACRTHGMSAADAERVLAEVDRAVEGGGKPAAVATIVLDEIAAGVRSDALLQAISARAQTGAAGGSNKVAQPVGGVREIRGELGSVIGGDDDRLHEGALDRIEDRWRPTTHTAIDVEVGGRKDGDSSEHGEHGDFGPQSHGMTPKHGGPTAAPRPKSTNWPHPSSGQKPRKWDGHEQKKVPSATKGGGR